MVFSKLFLENSLAIRPCNYGGTSEPLLPKVARCIPVLSSSYIGKCAARVKNRKVQGEGSSPDGAVYQYFFSNDLEMIFISGFISISALPESMRRPASPTVQLLKRTLRFSVYVAGAIVLMDALRRFTFPL